MLLSYRRKKRVYFPFDILRSKLFNYSKFILPCSNFIYIKNVKITYCSSAFSCFSSHIFNIEIYSYLNILCSHVQAKYSEVSMAWSIPCGWGEGHTFVSHLKVGGQKLFNQNVREGQLFLLKKIPKFLTPPPPRKNVPSLIRNVCAPNFIYLFNKIIILRGFGSLISLGRLGAWGHLALFKFFVVIRWRQNLLTYFFFQFPKERFFDGQTILMP